MDKSGQVKRSVPTPTAIELNTRQKAILVELESNKRNVYNRQTLAQTFNVSNKTIDRAFNGPKGLYDMGLVERALDEG